MKKKWIMVLLAGMMLCSTVSAEDATEAETAAEAQETDAAKLSDDVYSFEVLIDGELYAFPMTYEEFTSHGWECEEDEEEEFSPYSYASATFKKGDLKVYVTVMNLGVNTLPLSECDVAGFSVDEFQVREAPDTVIELPGGIVYGEASEEDIIAAYGTPSDTYEGDLYHMLNYQYDIYQEVELYVYNETGVLQDIDIKNMDEEKSATKNAEVVISDEVPESVLSYEAPTELGDDLTEYIVEYAGDLYQLPAPVSVFLENGWTLTSDSEEYVSGESSGWVYIRKDNQEFHTLAKNYEPNATSIENCFITSVTSNVNTTNLPMNLPKGITMGMTQEELVAALDGVEYELEDSSDMFAYYNIEDADSSLDGYQFLVNKEEGSVTGIEVSYQPRSLE